jgi:N-acetylmuramoyl-L-alanine amidase
MIGMKRTKYRLLREMVAENIRVVRGIRVKSFDRSKSRARRWLRRSFLIVAPLCLLASTYMISTGTAPRPEAATSPAVISQAPTTQPVSVPNQPEPSPVVPSFKPEPLDPAVFPLGVKRIVLDPGHGGEELGAVASSGIAEKDITLDIALRLRRLMTEHTRFNIVVTREMDETVPLAKRASIANSSGADIFISIHVNSMNSRLLRTVETYYLGPTKNPLAIKLASVENRDSGYSLGDYRRLLEKIYLDTRRDESHKLAKVIHGELYDSLRQVNGLLEDRGIKTAPFIVLVATEMPAILVEVSCLSNDEEARKLAGADYRERIAEALFRGIDAYVADLNGSAGRGG